MFNLFKKPRITVKYLDSVTEDWFGWDTIESSGAEFIGEGYTFEYATKSYKVTKVDNIVVFPGGNVEIKVLAEPALLEILEGH